MRLKTESSFVERPLDKTTAALVFFGLMMPVVVFFGAAVAVWETDALARSRANEEAMDQARIGAGYPPAEEARVGALLEFETARRIVVNHFANEASRLTAESEGDIVAMTVDEITNFCAETTDSGEVRGLLTVASASLLDDGPVRSEQRPFVVSIRRSRVAEVLFESTSR